MTTATFAHYRMAEKIGAGGMGDVYRAHDEQLDRDVAIKLIGPATADDPAARPRLLREARAAAALNHPLQLVRMKAEPRWDPLRGHPRFEQLLRRMKFPD